MSPRRISCKERWTACATSRPDGPEHETSMRDDQVWKRDEIESPCVKLCVVHPATRLCTGCLRSIDEITRWSKMTSDERRDVIKALPTRQGLHQQRRGGRAARLRNQD